MGLLQAIAGIAAGIREGYDIGAGILGLKDEGREIGCVDRMTDRSDNLPARSLNSGGAVGFDIFAEGIVGSDEEPFFAARFGQSLP
jgi:hypothetical protein